MFHKATKDAAAVSVTCKLCSNTPQLLHHKAAMGWWHHLHDLLNYVVTMWRYCSPTNVAMQFNKQLGCCLQICYLKGLMYCTAALG